MPHFVRLLLAALILASLSGASSLAQTKKPLRWGADAEGGAPYIFKDPTDINRHIGFEVDLAAALAQELGREIEFTQYPYGVLALGLDRGDIDLAMNGLEDTPDRRRKMRMSRPYYLYKLQLVIRRDETRFSTLAEIKQQKLTVGTLNETAASRLLAQEGIDTTTYESQAEPFTDLALGRTDAVLMDVPIAEYYGKSPELKFAGEPFALGPYAIMFRKDDEALAAEFDAAILRLAERGELERIYKKWNIWNEDQRQLAAKDINFKDVLVDSSQGFTPAKYLPLLLKGAQTTIILSCASMLVAMGVGLLVALARMYGPLPLRWLAIIYVEFFRGVPVLLLLYMFYFGLPAILKAWGIGWNPDRYFVAILTFGLNYAAYEAEIYRAGISSIPHGQWEAAASLGMSKWLTFRRIIWPQTWRVILPPVTNDFVALFKDTSLVSVITIYELTSYYTILSKSSLKYLEIGLATAALYLIMSVPLGYLSRWLERRLANA